MEESIKEDLKAAALKSHMPVHTRARMILEESKGAASEATMYDLNRRAETLRIEQISKTRAVIVEKAKQYPSVDKGAIIQYVQQVVKERDEAVYSMLKEEVQAQENPYAKSNIIIEDDTYANIIIPVYKVPTRTDMAVILVYFNACSYKKLAQNCLITYQTLIRSKIPVYLVEHCFKDQVPLFPENGTTIFNTRSDSYMFYKENLINWIMPKIPVQYTKFFTMDCDLFFEKDTWYDDVSLLLDTHDAVQPFEEAIWLKSDLKTIFHTKKSIINNDIEKRLWTHHPGFAWAFRRGFIEPIGVFDINICGSGDTIISSAVLQNVKYIEYNWIKYSPWMLEAANIYFKSYENIRYAYYNNKVYHLWHGSNDNRQYVDRYINLSKLCDKKGITTVEQLLERNSDGLYEFKESVREPLNALFLDYFRHRNEDGI